MIFRGQKMGLKKGLFGGILKKAVFEVLGGFGEVCQKG